MTDGDGTTGTPRRRETTAIDGRLTADLLSALAACAQPAEENEADEAEESDDNVAS
jgi:hypothetical protein